MKVAAGTETFSAEAIFHRKAALPFVIPSEAEGSAVSRTFRGNVFSTEPSAAEDPTRTSKSLLENLEAPFQLKLLASLFAGI